MPILTPIRNDELEEEHDVLMVNDNNHLPRIFSNIDLACEESHLPLQYALPRARAHL